MTASFADAVAALLASLDGRERVLDETSYLETRGSESHRVRQRLGVRRDGDAIVRWATHQRGDGAVEPSEMARYDERGFVDALLEESHLRQQLGLPEPTEDDQIERALVRLRAGHRFRSGGADDGGGHSGRPLTGGWTELSAESDRFVLELVSFEQRQGGEAVYETARQELGDRELRGLLATSQPLRQLIGIGRR